VHGNSVACPKEFSRVPAKLTSIERHASLPFSCCREDRIRDGRRDGRNWMLAKPTWRMIRGDNVGLNRRHFVHTQDVKIVKTGLHGRSMFEVDSPPQSSGKTPGDTAFHLAFETCRIDDQSTVHYAVNFVYTQISAIVGQRNFGDLGDVTISVVDVDGKATSYFSSGHRSQRRAPICFLPRDFQNANHAAAIKSVSGKGGCVTWLEEIDTELQRVFTAKVSHLVQE